MTTATHYTPLTGIYDPRVIAFLDAWHKRDAANYRRQYPTARLTQEDVDSWCGRKIAKDGRKYIRLDRNDNGVFMAEKTTGLVFLVLSYGQINRRRCVGQIEELIEDFTAAV